MAWYFYVLIVVGYFLMGGLITKLISIICPEQVLTVENVTMSILFWPAMLLVPIFIPLFIIIDLICKLFKIKAR